MEFRRIHLTNTSLISKKVLSENDTTMELTELWKNLKEKDESFDPAPIMKQIHRSVLLPLQSIETECRKKYVPKSSVYISGRGR